MVTRIFMLGYTILILLLIATEFIYWIYTGAWSIAWAEHLLSILMSKLFLQISIPCLLIDFAIIVLSENVDVAEIIYTVRKHFNKDEVK